MNNLNDKAYALPYHSTFHDIPFNGISFNRFSFEGFRFERFLKRLLIVLSVMVCSLLSQELYAAANLSVFPQKLVLEKDDKSGTIYLINRGDRSGLYELFWTHNVMTPEGTLMPHDNTDGVSTQALEKVARYAPKRVTLRPGERQVIKISIRARSSTPENEYFSHLSIRTLDEDLEQTEAQDDPDRPEDSVKFSITTQTVVGLPIVWRNTTDEAKGSVEILPTSTEEPNSISVRITRDTLPSLRGQLTIQHEGEDLIDPDFFVIYANLKSRDITFPLKEGLELSKFKGKKVTIQIAKEDDVDEVISTIETTL